jgi:uncharacterized protein
VAYVGLIVKATRLCNLRCAYCHEWRTGRDRRMSFRVLAATVAAALRDPGHDSVEFIWHGGEPTVLPRSFYEKAVYLQARLRRPGQRIRNALQTNATRVDGAWARFLRDNEFEVSVSLDGPPAIHDAQRRYASGRPSYDDVRRGIEVLQAHGLSVSVLMVVDRDVLELGADAVFDFFLENGITSYGLLAAKPTNLPDARPGTPAPHYVTPAEMTSFLIDVFDRWAAHGDSTIHIRELESVLRRVNGSSSSVCTLAGGCFGRYYLVETNGDVAHCDLFAGDPAYTLGNVGSDTFADLRASPTLHALRRANATALTSLRTCPEFDVCNGWCPHERYLAYRHDPAFDAACCGLSPLITHVRGWVERRRAEPVAATRG